MNLRILKKLSARAAPLLPLLGDTRQQFPAIEGNNYHGTVIRDRKCWDRSRCHPTYTGHGEAIVYTTRAGRRMVMRPPHHPLAGTIMVGGMSGYYEPEWDEECAWLALANLVWWHFTDWGDQVDSDGLPVPIRTRRLRTPSDIFRGAADMLAERRAAA